MRAIAACLGETSKSAKRPSHPPDPSRVTFFPRGAALWRGGSLWHRSLREHAWTGAGFGQPREGAPRISQPPRPPKRAGSNANIPPHRPVGGIAGRRRDPGREGPWVPTGSKGRKRRDLAARLSAPPFWKASGDGYFIPPYKLLRPINVRFSWPHALKGEPGGWDTVPSGCRHRASRRGCRGRDPPHIWDGDFCGRHLKFRSCHFQCGHRQGKRGSIPARRLRGFAQRGAK